MTKEISKQIIVCPKCKGKGITKDFGFIEGLLTLGVLWIPESICSDCKGEGILGWDYLMQ